MIIDETPSKTLKEVYTDAYVTAALEFAKACSRGEKPKPMQAATVEMLGAAEDLPNVINMCLAQIEIGLSTKRVVPGSRRAIQYEFIHRPGGMSGHLFTVEYEEAP